MRAGISGADGRNGVLKMWNVSLKAMHQLYV